MSNEFKKGDIVLVKFPFSDLSESKVRPALVIATIDGDNLLVSQITTNKCREKYSIEINNNLLNSISYVRLDFIMTLHKTLYLNKIGSISMDELLEFNLKFKEVFQL